MITRHHSKYYAELFVKMSVGDDVDSLSLSLISASVDVVPYRVEAALFVFKPYKYNGIVLAAELGLGKTIETGLVQCQ